MKRIAYGEIESGGFYTVMGNGRLNGMTARAIFTHSPLDIIGLDFHELGDFISPIGMALRKATDKEELQWRRLADKR